MYKKKHRHFVSADQFETERSRSFRDITYRKHKVTVSINPTKQRQGLIANLQNADQENGGQKYFLQKRHRKLKSRNSEVSGLSERKLVYSGVTTSLRKQKKSNRIHTIDHVDHIQQEIRQENSQAQMLQGRLILNDCINKKGNSYLDQVKNRIKKKSIINQSDFSDSKIGVCFTKKDKELIINLRSRKFNKSKIEGQGQQTEKSNRKSIKTSNNVYTIRSTINHIISKDDNHHQRSIKKCQISPNQCTIELKIPKKTEIKLKKSNSEYHQLCGRESIDQMKIEFNANKKNACFRKYMEFIDYSNKLKQKNIHKKIFKNLPQGRSLVIKNQLPHQAIQFKHERLSVQCAKSKEIYEIQETLCEKNETFDIMEKQNSKVFASNQFDCSSIPELNQSSFLSDNGKKQIAITAFHIQKDKSNILLGGSPKKKKKKQSKFGLICRSEMKQAFPDRFFA